MTTTTKPTDESKALAIRAQSQAITKFNPEKISIEAQALRALMPKTYGLPKGDKYHVTDEQLRALVIASLSSGLSPQRGEIYYLPTVGVMVASKVIAADAIAEQERLGNSLDIRFEKVTPEMCELAGSTYTRFAGAFEKGDVARACRIVSMKARRDHAHLRTIKANEGRAYDLRGLDLMRWVDAQIGPEPETIALGIVRSAEKFGGDEKYSREARAEKRALKAALTLGGYWAMDRRNYGGVKLADEIDASEETIEGDYTISEPAFNAGVHGMAEEHAEEPAEIMPVSAESRAKLSALIDVSESIKGMVVRDMNIAEKAKFADALRSFVAEINAQLKARGMAEIVAAGSETARAQCAAALEAMRQHDERAPLAEPEPATSPAS